jgi:hypothetical protein
MGMSKLNEIVAIFQKEAKGETPCDYSKRNHPEEK